MSQKQKPLPKPDAEEFDGAAALQKIFDKVTQKADRTVILKFKSCCGCGCDWIKVKRTVPFDSLLKDGDQVMTLEETDKFPDR